MIIWILWITDYTQQVTRRIHGAGIYVNIKGYIDGKCHHIWHTWILWVMDYGLIIDSAMIIVSTLDVILLWKKQ